MAKHFVVSTTPLSKGDESELKDLFQGALWWHWLPNFWLVMDKHDNLDCLKIAKEINRINPAASAFVTEVMPVTWNGIAAPDEGSRMKSWMNEGWLPNKPD